MKLQMKSAMLIVALSSLTTASLSVGERTAQAPTLKRLAPPEFCYAPGTSMDVMQRNASQRRATMTSLLGQGFQLEEGGRWSCTATSCDLTQGQVTTLTWNIVPDGTFVKGFGGEPDGVSNLKAFLTTAYNGSEAAWIAHFQTVFDRWGALTGVNYVKVNYDDGSALANNGISPYNPGQLGVRADIRISGHFIDGNINTLAYNFFPDVGDMVFDTGDNYYRNEGQSNSSLGFRNIIAHEHGHGLGLDHSCPVQQKKLMEPTLATAFTHAQIDDRLAGWRGYGDDKEDNETAGTASQLGTLGNGTTTVNELSVDDDSDIDFYSFTVPASKKATVTVTPFLGAPHDDPYLAGPQNQNGTCTVGTSFNPLTINDLGVELLSTNGATILGAANDFGAGSAETVPATELPGAGTYFIRAFGGPVNNVQGYRLQVTISDAIVPVPPTVTTAAATNLTLSTATLNGTVNPNGFSTTAAFQYGTTVAYGFIAAATAPGSGSSVEGVSAGIAGLTCGTTYHARLTATNSGGTTNGNDITFQTSPCPPSVTTTAATSIAQTTATLNGTVNPNGASTVAVFQYGPTLAYGIQVPVATPPGSGLGTVAIDAAISGLSCNTTYHVRAVATNSGGSTYGNDVPFVTSPCAPSVASSAASDVAVTAANLSANVTSDGGGTVTERGFVHSLFGANPDPSIGGGGVTKVPVAGTTGAFGTSVSPLTASTTYAFKAFATNSAGTTYSPVLTFTTSDPAAPEALVARTVALNSAARSAVSNAAPQVWFRARLFANRSYQISAWPVDHEQGVDAAKLSVTVFSDDAGTVQANGVTGISTVLESAPNEGGDDKPFTATVLPTTSGVYKIRVLRVSGGAVPHTVNLMIRETTLFSPWTSRAAGFEGFIEMHNNTNAAISVTLRGFDSTGTLQGAGLTLTLQPNATDFRTANQVGVPVNVFAGIVLTHNGTFGAVSANITTLNGATGLSFDSVFTSRNPTAVGPPIR